MQAMKKRVGWLLIGLLLSVTVLWSQSDVSLRARVVSSYTQQVVNGNCGVEFGLAVAGDDPQVYVCLGWSTGATVYRYTPGSSPERVGHVALNPIVDVDYAGTTSEAYLALTDSSNGVYLLRLTAGSGGALTPYGRAGLSASRCQIERLSSGAYLVLVGTTSGRVRVYVWTPGSPASSPGGSLSLGTPVVDLPLFSGSVQALRAWTVSGTTYVAVGGLDGIVYLFRWDGSGLVQVGKAMYHPSAVSEIVVNGSRLVVGCANGQVYVWNYTSGSVVHHLTLKEPWAGLGAHSLCALPGDQVAVATAFVRVYRLSDGLQTGEYGGVVWANYLRDYYWWAPQFSSYTWHPSFYRFHQARVLPAVGTGSYFVLTAPSTATGSFSRTLFLASSGFSYNVVAGSYPVYALSSAANGVASGRSDGSVQAPWGSRNVGAPVFALESFPVGTTTWLLGSYGVGRVFAWSSGNAYVADVLPAPSAPRIVYGLRVLSVSNNQVTFVTCGGDGVVELCRWDIGSTTPAVCLSAQQVNRPLHTISVNANRTEVAASSWLPTEGSYGSANAAWRFDISGTMLSAPTALGNYKFVAYHPTDPDLLAYSQWNGRIALYRRSVNQSSVVHAGQVGRWWTYDFALLGDPLLLAWSSGDRLVGAYLYNGYVGVWWPGADTVTHAYEPFDRNRNGQYDDPNWIRGGYDRALQEIYEPHRDRVFALITLPSGEIVSGGSDGRVVRWVRAGQPLYTTWYLSRLNSMDFVPYSGQAVYPARVMLSDTRHALLWSNFNWDYHSLGGAVLALSVPGGAGAIRARAVSPWLSHDVYDTDITIRYIFPEVYSYWSNYPSIYPTYRIEASEDGSWAMVDVSAARFNLGSNQYERRAYLGLRPFYTGGVAGNFQISFPDGVVPGSNALSPSAARVAVSVAGSEVRVYDRSGNSWNFTTPTSTISIAFPDPGHLKFLADDVLAIAYRGANGILQIDVYQLSGGSWVLRQTLDTGLVRSFPVYHGRYFIDAIAVGSTVRVAVACDLGLVFYRMDRPGGVVTLTEVGRSTWAANSFWDVAGHHWVRFSRYNPNIVGVANGFQTVAYDLTGLFNW